MGIVNVLPDRLRGLTRAVLATSLLHIHWLTSYLTNRLDDVGHHANRVKKGSTPCLSSLEELIKRA